MAHTIVYLNIIIQEHNRTGRQDAGVTQLINYSLPPLIVIVNLSSHSLVQVHCIYNNMMMTPGICWQFSNIIMVGYRPLYDCR